MACAFAALMAAAAARADDTRPRALPVAPGAWMVQGVSALGSSANRNFISNAAFIETARSVVVVDALGAPSLAAELREEIARVTQPLGGRPKPVTHVFVTHYHADHIYGLQTFAAEGAQIVAHRDARHYLQSDTARRRLEASRSDLFPWVDAHTRLVPANVWIDAPRTFEIDGERFVVQPAGPAHTLEDLVVWLPARRLLIAGDLVFRGRIPFVGQADSGQWIAALDRLLAFDAQVIVPGHGAPSMDAATARADLELTRDYLVHLRRSMGEAARNLEPFDEAYARTDWSRFARLPLFAAANRINAYNTYLLMEQQADAPPSAAPAAPAPAPAPAPATPASEAR